MFLKVEGGQAFPRSTMAYHRLLDMAECVTPQLEVSVSQSSVIQDLSG